jgi:lysozyme family protein
MALQETILARILQEEGGWVDHPLDRGGPTHRGITLRTLSEWRKSPQTVEDLKALGEEETKEIYRWRYLEPFNGVPPEVLSQAADIGVLHGVGTAKRMVERLKAQGRLTNRALLGERIDLMAEIVKSKPEQRFFLKGWLRRALRVGGA